jgi:hypothetical protein
MTLQSVDLQLYLINCAQTYCYIYANCSLFSCTYLPADPEVVSFFLTKVRAVTPVQHLKSIVERSSNEATNSDEVIVRFRSQMFIATVHAHNKTTLIAVCVCLLRNRDLRVLESKTGKFIRYVWIWTGSTECWSIRFPHAVPLLSSVVFHPSLRWEVSPILTSKTCLCRGNNNNVCLSLM